ncbi:MAG: hypothetical protein GY816_17365 [Cytophagales bacterium]|nr:hypothetical protein [Cytophagales bacterium]
MAKVDTRDVLQSIKQPEQREMLKRYSLAQNMLKDPNRNIAEYHEAMGDFSVLKIVKKQLVYHNHLWRKNDSMSRMK